MATKRQAGKKAAMVKKGLGPKIASKIAGIKKPRKK